MFIICERGGEGGVDCPFTLLISYIKCVSALAPAVIPTEEEFANIGYFQRTTPAYTDVPSQKIAGTCILENTI